MRVVAHPLPLPWQARLRARWRRLRWPTVPGLLGVGLIVLGLPGAHGSPVSRGVHASPRHGPLSWIAGSTLVSVYGRGFGIAPVLGRLGQDHSFSNVLKDVSPTVQAVRVWSPDRVPRIALHLIYGLAVPCGTSDHCLLYLDDAGTDIVTRYIKPAAKRGWLVVLDDQLGRSTPRREIERMQHRGYLRYDNVEVAFDPEFRTDTQWDTPGVPIGHVTAAELNGAQALLDTIGRRSGLAHRKLMLVHQWCPGMIRMPGRLRTDYPYSQPAVVMDGVGTPEDKGRIYNSLLKPVENGVLPGVKLFPPNVYDAAAPVDQPVLSWRQLFGRDPFDDSGLQAQFLARLPRIIVLT